MIYKTFFLLVSMFIFTQASAETVSTTNNYVPADVIVKQDLIFSKESNELLDGKIIIKEAIKPSFIEVEQGVINKFFVFTPSNSTKTYYKNRQVDYLKAEGNNKPMEIKYIDGVINTLKLDSPKTKMDASFDEKSQVLEFKGTFKGNDLIIEYKDQVIVYTKLSTNKELQRLNAQHEKYPRAFSKLNNMLSKMNASTLPYSRLLTMLATPPKKAAMTLSQCKAFLGEEKFAEMQALLDLDAAVLQYCKSQAKKKK